MNEDEKRPFEGDGGGDREKQRGVMKSRWALEGKDILIFFKNWYLKLKGIQRPLFPMFWGFFSVARKLLGGQRPD